MGRNLKQTQRQTNSQIGKIQNTNPKELCLEFYIFWSFEIVSYFGSFDKAQDRFMLRIFVLGDLTTLAFSLSGDGDFRRAGPFDNRHYFYRVTEQHVFVAAQNDSLVRARV
jgi:hypothetical protein